MAAPGSEVEIEVDTTLVRTPVKSDDTIDKDGGEGANPEGGAAITDDDIVALRKDLEAAKAERDAAKRGETTANTRASQTEQQARETAARLASEVSTRVTEQAAAIESGIVATQGEIDGLRDATAKALEEGKWADAARLQEEMSDAKLRMREFTYQKGEIERYKERAKSQPTPANNGVGTKTADWIAKHPKFNTDPVYRAEALLAHEKAVEAGVALESDKYFEMVEIALGEREAPKAPANDDGEGEKAPVRSSGIAPVQRRSAPGNGGNDGGRKTIKLSSDQVEAADAMFGDPTSAMYIKDAKERYTYWHTQSERLKSEGRL